MKEEVLQTLLTAKVLLNKAQDMCFVEDNYTASSGLIVLQDALEHIFIACLIERGVDEVKTIGALNFNQLISELKKAEVNVIKSGTLKALNRDRITIKHYGQVAAPSTVANYYKTAEYAVNDLLKQVIGKNLHDIALHELIQNKEVKEYLNNSIKDIEDKNYFYALVNTRKAIYVEIENDYCIYGWRDYEGSESGLLAALTRGGLKAPWFTRNQKWIAEHVFNPFDYIQIDHDQLRQDLLEWGASTQDFWNIWRLTPMVIRLSTKDGWLLEKDPKYIRQGATEENTRYCLDRAATLLYKKQTHHNLSRCLDYLPEDEMRVLIKHNEPLYRKATKDSEKVATLNADITYRATTVVPGLDGKGRFVRILHIQEEEPQSLNGYVDLDACKLLDLQSLCDD